MSMNIIEIALGILAGFIFTYLVVKILLLKHEKTEAKKKIKNASGIQNTNINKNFVIDGFALKVLTYLVKISFSNKNNFVVAKFIKKTKLNDKLCKLAHMSSMPESFCNLTLRESQLRFSLLFFCIGLVLGYIFSLLLGIMLASVGLILGFYLPVWAMKKEIECKKNDLEKNLPEMLEVVSLGLRSGLTFDRSFNLYHLHFNNSFSNLCKSTQTKWTSGITTREVALKELASVYDNFLFNRVIDNIIRSIRFGSSLVDSLEEAAVESRTIYKSAQEEKVAKAPVKMMIPTGTLILPAMLMLVLGPILLNLIGGF